MPFEHPPLFLPFDKYVCSVAFLTGTKQDIQGTAGRIVLLTALLLGTVTYIHYTSFLISALSVNRLLLPFTTLAELTRVDSHQLMVLKSTVQEDVLKVRGSGPQENLTNKINPRDTNSIYFI